MLPRRRILRLVLALPAGVAAAACTDGTDHTAGPASTAEPTPSCVDDDDETPAQTEGPYFSPGSPERADLREAGMGGTSLILTGFVYDTACRPIAHALLDFWQADDGGRYDNSGFRLRGHQFTAADGSYRLSTIVPGLYTGRTRHIHVKAQRPNGPVLTTQLYFPGEARNARDSIFNEALQLHGYRDQDGGKTGWFSFVLKG
jgi:protocatechuate 3,4-dioxygenase beta subunit